MLKQKIRENLKLAMKNNDVLTRDVLRMMDSMIKNAEIEKKKKEKGLSDEEVQAVLARAVKQRKDSVEQYEKAGRSELAEKEKKEIEILNRYMPEQMNKADLKKEIADIISQTGAQSKEDIGRVMGMAMGKLKGKADGNIVKKNRRRRIRKIRVSY